MDSETGLIAVDNHPILLLNPSTSGSAAQLPGFPILCLLTVWVQPAAVACNHLTAIECGLSFNKEIKESIPSNDSFLVTSLHVFTG